MEAVFGRIGVDGKLEDAEFLILSPVERRGSITVFVGEVAPSLTGRLGYTIRTSPRFSGDPLTRPCDPLLTWATVANEEP